MLLYQRTAARSTGLFGNHWRTVWRQTFTPSGAPLVSKQVRSENSAALCRFACRPFGGQSGRFWYV